MTVEREIPAAGAKAPDFTLPDKDGKTVHLRDFRGSWVVLYFYPKDNTSGCTLEATDFTAEIDELKKLGAVVLGVSPDSPESHCSFYDRHSLRVTLLSDTGRETLEKYGVWKKKSMYGKEFFGVVRSTFLIDPEGSIAHVWNRVKVPNHAAEVKKRLAELRRS